MQNSNYQEQIPPRRRIIFVQRNRTFNEFQKNQNRIIKEYEKSSKELMIQSFSIIAAKLFGEKSNAFLQKKSINIMQEPNPIENLNQHIQKKIQGEEQAKKQMQPFSMKKKNTIGYNKKSPEKQNKVSKNHNKLINQLSRLSVDEKFSDQNQSTNDRQSNYTNLLKFDEDLLKNKTISQLLHESNMKSKNRKEVFEPIVESQSSQQYQMTDYSSNESSNDDKNYEQIYLYQDQIKPLFGNLFINKSQTLSENQNSTYCYESKFQFQKKTQQLNFQNKKLLESPRKTKSQMKKRLFIREKKIPRWAENLKQVSEIVEKQRKELDFLNLYGIFVVQNLQTNTVFGINEDYKRTSSARWYKNKNGYVC